MDSITRKRPVGTRRQGVAPTISDVANLAGVSPMTVSRVINGKMNVRESRRNAVNSAIEALNYAPNRAARSLAGAGQTRIGLLYSNPSGAYLSEFLVGSLDQASRSDAQLLVQKCEVGDHEAEVAERFVNGGVSGVLLPPPLCDSAAVLAILRESGTPTVLIASGAPPRDMCAVKIDDFGAALAMTRHILSLGHRRIGFITGNPNQTASGQRLAGYRAALAEAGLPEDEALIAGGLFTYRSGLDAAELLLDHAGDLSAIFASNDDMAAAAVAVAHRRGLDVPRDLTVCGFDDTALAGTIWPQLTTIHQPIADMSRAAVELLVAQVQNGRGGAQDEVPQLELDFTLVRRQSDAVPRRPASPVPAGES